MTATAKALLDSLATPTPAARELLAALARPVVPPAVRAIGRGR